MDVKAALKEARSDLRENRFIDAMKRCQQVLKVENDNYMAFVMLAAALREIDEHKSQAPLALKKAIALHPDKPLAWQGLVAYYEKEPDTEVTRALLVPAYCKLLQLESESSKFKQYTSEIGKLSMQLEDMAIVQSVVDALSTLDSSNLARDKSALLKRLLMDILAKYPKIARKREELHASVLSWAIDDEDSLKNRQKYFQKYLKILYAKGAFEAVLGAAAKMFQQYPKDPFSLERICLVYSEQSIVNGKFSCAGVDIKEIYEALFLLEPASYLANFAKGVQLWHDDNLIEARDALNKAVYLNPKLWHAWLLLGEVNLGLYCWTEAENSARQALEIVGSQGSEEIRERMDLVFVEAIARGEKNTEKVFQAIENCEQRLKKNPTKRVKLLLARACVRIDAENVEEMLQELENDNETRMEASILRSLRLMKLERYEEATDVIGPYLETSEAWMIFGEIKWIMNEWGHSVMAFLKAIHADPNNYQGFLYLGHFYRERGNDLEKSRKCYQKALRINPNSDEAGVGLSTAFRLLKNKEANMQMLLRVTTSEGGGPKWAWLQLGLQHLDQGEISQAIKSLRYVIRADPHDNHCWESLADAYLAQGAHGCALKSYQRALELCPDSLYPMIQLANIKFVLGQHEEAQEDFGNVLGLEPRYIPALKGLAETCLGLAKEHTRKQLLGRARRNIQEAVDRLTDAIIENSELSCIWKLLGDACYRVAVLPVKYSHIEIMPGLMKSDSKEERIVIGKRQLFILSSRCYCRALRLSGDSALLWHDLASCYLSQLKSESTNNRQELAEKCKAAAQQAVRLCSSSWIHWNILAAVCLTEEVKNYALAQHCCVMAIDREPNNAIAWTNLGTMYLRIGDRHKANEAFSRAQRVDPDYANCWIGQSMIAEFMDRKEAMDLYRHSTGLGYHSQAAIGYAHWVLTTLLDPAAKNDPLYTYIIENMHAVAVATDAMTWYIEQIPDDSCARNAYGLLLERQKLYRPALHEFEEALSLEKDEGRRDLIAMNRARILVQLGAYEEAVKCCGIIKVASFQSQCQLALALFKANRFEESYAAYEATLHGFADSGSEKAHILCAMAAMAYMFQEVNDVKTLLFQCIQIQPPTVSGLLAAAAFGLLHDDENLTSLVLDELAQYKDDPKYRRDVATLDAYSCLVRQDVEGAIRALSKAVHRHPDDVECWVGLVKILLQTNSPSFANCAQKAMLLGRKTSATGIPQVACISSLADLEANETSHFSAEQMATRGLRSVQKTVFSFPGNVESWANFVIGLSIRLKVNDSRPNAAWIAQLISNVRSQFTVTKAMDDWLAKNHTEVTRIVSTNIACEPIK